MRRRITAALASLVVFIGAALGTATPASADQGYCVTKLGSQFVTCFRDYNMVGYGGGLIVTADVLDAATISYKKLALVYHYQGGQWVVIGNSGYVYNQQQATAQIGSGDTNCHDFLIFGENWDVGLNVIASDLSYPKGC